MNYSQGYLGLTLQAVSDLYAKVITYVPQVLFALIVLIIGWFLAKLLSTLVLKILQAIKIDDLANQLGLKTLGERAGKKLSLAALGQWLVKWFFFLATILAAVDILNLQEVSTFFYQDVLTYAGHVLVAMATLLLGILAANFLAELVTSTVKASGLHSGESLGAMTRWAVVIFAVIAALSQLQIATSFLADLFRGVVALLAIAGGLAFGLGGKEHASKVLDKIESSLKS